MPKKSKIDIFNVMSEEELDEALETLDYPIRYYQRLIAMKLISTGHNHKETGEILRVSYRSINRWAKACEKDGLDGLIPNFSGGKPSKLSEENKVQFKQILIEGENLTMTDAQRILKDDFGIEFSLPHVCNIVRQLGFNYGKPRPKFREAPENGEEILKKNIDFARITIHDIVIALDESTIKTGIGTRKTIYPEGEENTTQIIAKSYSVNFLGVLGFNCESLLFDIKNLNEFEFGKSLFKIRNFYSQEEQDIKLLNYIMDNYDLSKKDIRKIIEDNDKNNEDFTGKILKSMKRNKHDKSSILARKLGKHCKRESTENPDKIKKTKKDYIYQMIKDLEIYQIFQNRPRIVIFLDNARAHISDFAQDIAEALNIYLLYIPEYSPWFDPVENIWDIHKKYIKGIVIESKERLIDESHKIFNEKCMGDSLQKNFKEKYLTSIC